MSHRIIARSGSDSIEPGVGVMSMSTATAAPRKDSSKPAAKSSPETGTKKAAKKPGTAAKKSGTAAKSGTAKKSGTAAKKSGNGAKKAGTTQTTKKTVKGTALVISKGAAKVKRSQKTDSKPARNGGSSGPMRSRTSKVLKRLNQMRRDDQEGYFESVESAELIGLFDGSFPADLVNLLMGLKPFTCRRIFETLVNHRKKAYLDTITLYYYNRYLTNPLPMQVGSAVSALQVLPNYYAIIGVAKDATEGEISEAAKLLLKAFDTASFHPSERAGSEGKRTEIRKAFNQLKSEKRRQEVDRELPSINYLYPRRDQSWIANIERLMP